VGTLGEPVDESFDSIVLQELIERAGGFLGFVEKALMNRCSGIPDVLCH